ncbi:MAG: hypothetical protein AB8F74_22830 [Saprospiraceae bacterium]
MLRKKWPKTSPSSYEDFEIPDFDHSPYIDYDFLNPEVTSGQSTS